MTKRNLKFTFYLLITICLTLGLSISLQSLLAAWTPPSGSAPSDNVPPPVYASSTSDQIISGGGDLGVEGDLAVIQMEASTLHVYKASGNTELTVESDNGEGNIILDGSGTTQADNIYFKVLGTERFRIRADSTNDKLYITEDGGAGITLTNAGNVGIGEAAPSQKLDVNGTVKATSFQGDGSGLTGLSTSPWTVSGLDIYYDAGNVGIGTAIPAEKLDVNGKIRATEICDETGAVCNDTSDSWKDIPDNFVPITTNSGNAIFFLQINHPQRYYSIIDGAESLYKYECYFRLSGSTPQIMARMRWGSSHENLVCNSGWVDGTLAQCTWVTRTIQCSLGYNRIILHLNGIFYQYWFLN